jgi:hypothetical protein
MTAKFWEYTALTIILLLAFVSGMLVSEKQHQCPPCPPTVSTTNSITLGKVKNASGPWDLSMAYARKDSIKTIEYVPCDSLKAYMNDRWWRVTMERMRSAHSKKAKQ